MLNEIEEILNEYEEELDREYDNNQNLMLQKVNTSMQMLKNELRILLSAVPQDISRDTVAKLKRIL